jgi:ureidoacrylate peracid hydrolase
MHRVSIPDYILERVVARRGTVTLFERLAARNTALLVIDMQNAFMQEGMASYLPGATDLVPNVNTLAAALRRAGGRVVWIRHTADPSWDVYGRFSKPEHREAALASYTPGHVGHAIHASLAVEPNDLTIDKRRFSALIQGSSDLDSRLRGMGVDTVVIAGVVTNSCCECTARDAMMLNYKTVFVSDANGARTDEEHNATLGNILRLFGDVATTDEIIARLT